MYEELEREIKDFIQYRIEGHEKSEIFVLQAPTSSSMLFISTAVQQFRPRLLLLAPYPARSASNARGGLDHD